MKGIVIESVHNDDMESVTLSLISPMKGRLGDLEVNLNELVEVMIENLEGKEPLQHVIGKFRDDERHVDALVEALNENVHCNLDGWEEGEKFVIRRFLRDVQLYIYETVK